MRGKILPFLSKLEEDRIIDFISLNDLISISDHPLRDLNFDHIGDIMKCPFYVSHVNGIDILKLNDFVDHYRIRDMKSFMRSFNQLKDQQSR